MNKPNRQERREIRWVQYSARWLTGAVVAIALLAAGVAIGWGKWVKPTLLDTDAKNRRSTYERQESTRVAVTRKISDFTAATSDAHRNALRIEICELADQLRGDTSLSIQTFVSTNC